MPSAPRYVLFYEPAEDFRARVPAHFAAHRALWGRFSAEGLLTMIGPFTDAPAGGAMGVFATRDAAERFANEDPFVAHGVVARWTVREWMEALAAPAPAFGLTPIGRVRSTRAEPTDDAWDRETASIELDPGQYTPDALAGLDQFSHVEVVYLFDRVDPSRVEAGARHPRDNPSWPRVGIFAQRGKSRPNRLGTTLCRVDRVEGLTVHVTGLDAIDGTPVIDLKPWMRAFAPRGETREPAWVGELMAGYWATER